MSRRVSILPDAVADQIAAGEVVERPASAVKELVENALDAGARHVTISIENGGKTRIEVIDDGSGMLREDAVLSIDRHATSKIASVSDLVGITTFGFRGEALPAIASVSRFELISAPADGPATHLTVNGGRLDRVADAVRRRGTTVTVRSLFYNVPARRKFLRSAQSESRAATDAVATLALAHPKAGFELVIDSETKLHVPEGQTSSDRLASVWGKDVAGTFVPVDFAQGTVRVTGFVQRPGDAKPTGRRTQLFVNGRPFKDSFLIRAAEKGYRSAIHPGDRPSLFLSLEVPPDLVDVNVHPAKLEVRFRDRLETERVMEEAVRHALGGIAAASPVGDWRAMPSEMSPSWMPAAPLPPHQEPNSPTIAAPIAASYALFAPDVVAPLPNASPTQPTAAPYLPQHVSHLFESYIVYEAADGLVFVDQHSAHERVLYEETMRTLSAGGGSSQRLLLPISIECTDEELDAIEAHAAEIERLGFEVAPFGGRTVLMHAAPAPHARFDAGACFRELVSDLARGRFGGWANRLERCAATYACRAAVKAGMPMTDREMRALLSRLFACELPPHDVHGRSTIVQLPRDELERRFGRR